MPLRIAINGHLLDMSNTYRNAGVGQYIWQLLEHVTPGSNEEYLVFVPKHLGDHHLPQVGKLRYIVSAIPTSKPALRAVWEQAVLPACLVRCAVDVLHCPVNVAPMSTLCRTIVTIHDLSFVRYPGNFRPSRRRYQNLMTRASARRAVMVMADSAATRVDLMRQFGVGAERIRVVYPGVTGAFRTFATDILDKFRRRVMHGRPYFVHVGTLEPRKNLTRLVEAFAALKRDIGIPHALALVGGKGWMYDGLLERVRELGLDNDVVFPGFAAPEELPLWYAAAEALVYPSLYEGFGFPVVEAMACGTPVICSNVSSLPEVAGDAAVLVDPDDVRALTNSMRRVFDDRLFRQELVRRGLERARAFTWEATALGVQEAYRTIGASACK